MNFTHIIHSLISLHKAIGGAWCVEIRNGNGFSTPEIIISANTVEDQDRLARDFGITLGRVLSVVGDTWWADGSRLIDGVDARVTGPHFPVVAAEAVQP